MGEYRGGPTLGGKIGCAAAAIVGVPLIGIVSIISSFGDCVPDSECHRGMDWPLLAGALAIAAAVGFSVRLFTNWIKTRWSSGD